MATQRPNRDKNKMFEHMNRLPVFRPSLFYSDRGRAQMTAIEEHKQSRRAELWAEVERAEARLTAKHTPQKLHTFRRLHAQWEAMTAADMLFCAHRVLTLCELETHNDFVRWIEEQRHLENVWFNAKTRSTHLSVFAPMGDVGVSHRLWKSMTFVAILPFYGISWAGTAALLPFVRRLSKVTEEAAARSKECSSDSKEKKGM